MAKYTYTIGQQDDGNIDHYSKSERRRKLSSNERSTIAFSAPPSAEEKEESDEQRKCEEYPANDRINNGHR